MKLTKCYKYRLHPKPEQEKMFLLFAASRRFVYNWALQRRKEHYAATKKSLSAFDLNKELTLLKKTPEGEWLQESANALLQESIRDLDRAFSAFFKKIARYPKFRSKNNTPPSFRLPERVRPQTGGVSIPKIGVVKCKLDRHMDGDVKSATIKQEPDGRWYVTFVVHKELPDAPATRNNPVGIDLGLKTHAALSTGEKIDYPRYFRKFERKLARLQRQKSRCVKGSKNSQKVRLAIAKLHQKVKNHRDDFQHKVSKRLVEEHDTICLETLGIKQMMNKKRRLGKSFSDAGLGEFVFKLDYKSKWRYGRVVQIDRKFPSSKMCGACEKLTKLDFSDRHWTCASCGSEHDRDLNAATNILREGLRIVS
jgi:putative transposase